MVAEACLARRTVICSDEIHNQLVLEPGMRHVPMALLGPEVAARTITLLAPSKAFNVAGLGCSVAVIPDDDLRRRFKRAMAGIVPEVNVMGFVAAEAAWTAGADWLAAQNAYLLGNRGLLEQEIAALPGMTMAKVEATYLAWLDVRESGPGRSGGPLRGPRPGSQRRSRVRRAGLPAPELRLPPGHADRGLRAAAAGGRRSRLTRGRTAEKRGREGRSPPSLVVAAAT